MRIGNRDIGPLHPPYIIAELGVNHDGDPKRALELVRLAAEAGADAIKLQLFKADMLMSKAAKLAAYQKAAGETDPIEMLRRLELSIEDMKPCVDLAHELNIHAIVSVFSVELVEVAETLPWDAYKTASPDIINRPLLDALAKTGKPLIVSTGASTIEEVKRMVEWLRPIHERLAVLQCVSSYPTPETETEIGGIRAIAEVFGGPVGYSDHTKGSGAGAQAVAWGAAILEKHFTYSRQAVGPDHAASLTAMMFPNYASAARRARGTWERREELWNDDAATHAWDEMKTISDLPDVRTDPRADFALRAKLISKSLVKHTEKRILPIEQDVRTVSRQSLTTTRDLLQGHILTRADLTIKRPGTGIPPFELDATLGKRLTRAIEADMPLMAGDVK
jgi:sialic acid synthase SpsE